MLQENTETSFQPLRYKNAMGSITIDNTMLTLCILR